MLIEDKLKSYILSKYRSLREFTQAIGIPYSTMSTILKRGIANSSVVNIIKICKELGISADELASGKIVPIVSAINPPVKIEDILSNAKQQLLNADCLTLDGDPVSTDEIMLLVSTLDVALEVAKKQHKG